MMREVSCARSVESSWIGVSKATLKVMTTALYSKRFIGTSALLLYGYACYPSICPTSKYSLRLAHGLESHELEYKDPFAVNVRTIAARVGVTDAERLSIRVGGQSAGASIGTNRTLKQCGACIVLPWELYDAFYAPSHLHKVYDIPQRDEIDFTLAHECAHIARNHAMYTAAFLPVSLVGSCVAIRTIPNKVIGGIIGVLGLVGGNMYLSWSFEHEADQVAAESGFARGGIHCFQRKLSRNCAIRSRLHTRMITENGNYLGDPSHPLLTSRIKRLIRLTRSDTTLNWLLHMRRSLVRGLLDPQSKGVAGGWATRRSLYSVLFLLQRPLSYNFVAYVQERVHSTNLGADATSVFLLHVIDELEDAIREFLPLPPPSQPLGHEDEVELGTLLSAASMTIRYVTERQVMIPLLERYRNAFTTVLRYPAWTHTCYYGLKAVALMGWTRILESFSDQVSSNDVLDHVRWLFTLFHDKTSLHTSERVLRFNTLLPPACEYVAVTLQTHDATREMLFTEVLPQLFELLVTEDTEENSPKVAEAVQLELATTAAVILETKVPFTSRNTFSLLSLPEFVEEMEATGSKIVVAPINTEESTRGDEQEDKVASTKEVEEKCCKLLCAWLDLASRRCVAAQALAVMYRAIHASCDDVASVATGAMVHTSPLEEMTKVLQDTALSTLSDLHFLHTLLESIRDILLYQQKFAPSTLENAFTAMSTVKSRLEVALMAFQKRSVERRSAKRACSSIRYTLVETFLAWLHHPDTATMLSLQVTFLHNVAGTLADPRIYGDVLALLRDSTVPEARTEYDAGRHRAVATLCEAITQLERYSKSTANRIVSGLTRIAAACREDIYPQANVLVRPLLPSMLDGSEWGKFLRLRTEAVATVLLASAAHPAFHVDQHAWIPDFVRFLLEPVVASENVHSFRILCALIRAERKLLLEVVSFCLTHPHTVTQTLHEPLTRWPLYEEDMDLVVLTLELLDMLLSVQTLRETLAVDVIRATIVQLWESAASEGLDPITVACTRLVESLGARPAT
ncbi:hypothetical protein PsorP6_000668 [Peronosclerospora sorghi]|uniref:Uncharacterized protein n=1 Tax=Peronosclerospora sorghi TaxID=230839 RepID=A0ACC0WUM0_9STRA|nr:hypothetical protein PsorP6_000668 [Peronosclerospora sorghi]